MRDPPIIGIDLGTTNSLVSYFSDDGPRLIPNTLGQYLTPSAIALDKDGGVIVGQAAKDMLVSDAERSAARFKRFMGTDHEISLGKKKFRAEELSAMVLRSLKADAEEHLGEPVKEAVISVPAYFNNLQRRATIAAAYIAGLGVRRLINEPTAAALAYGLHDREAESTFLVVDLGGGTFDVSILEMFSGVMEVRASAGDIFLGGEDFTDILTRCFAKDIGVEVDSFTKNELSRLRGLADQAKQKLSDRNEVEFVFSYKEKEHLLKISSQRFETETEALIKRLRMPIQRAISDAGLKVDQLDRILLVGGATKMPLIRTAITKLFRRFPEFDLDPDHVVALGAAVQAGLAQNHASLDDVVMTDVSPFTLGVEVSKKLDQRGRHEAGFFAPIIERNTVIPASRVEQISTMEPGQNVVTLNVYQGEAPLVRDNVFLGSLTINVPINKASCEVVDVRFTYDNSGVLEVIAKIISSSHEHRLIIEGSSGSMSRAEIDKRFKDLERLKVHPRCESHNAALVARITKIYENSLGNRRSYLSDMLSDFRSVLDRQDQRQIIEVREKLTSQLDLLETDNVL